MSFKPLHARTVPAMPLVQSVKMFSGLDSLIRHLLKHFLIEGTEGRLWGRVFNFKEEPWKLAKRRVLSGMVGCQDLHRRAASIAGPLQGVYDSIADYCEKGIRYSIGTPVYGVTTEIWAKNLVGNRVKRLTWHFISQDGALMVVWGGILRTAYMSASCRGDSPREVYAQALQSVLHRVSACQQGRIRHGADEDSQVTGLKGLLFNRENFCKGSIPWPAGERKRAFKESGERHRQRSLIGGYEYDEE